MPKISTNSRFTKWLMKSDMPHTIEYLESQPEARMKWNGIRNFEARKILTDFMPVGSLAFFYMSGVPRPAIYGIIKVIKAAYPCELWVPANPEEKNPWFQVDVELVRRLKRPIFLTELKSHMDTSLKDMVLFRRQRLSISGVSDPQWDFIVDLENKAPLPEVKKPQKARKKKTEKTEKAEKAEKAEGGEEGEEAEEGEKAEDPPSKKAKSAKE